MIQFDLGLSWSLNGLLMCEKPLYVQSQYRQNYMCEETICGEFYALAAYVQGASLWGVITWAANGTRSHYMRVLNSCKAIMCHSVRGTQLCGHNFNQNVIMWVWSSTSWLFFLQSYTFSSWINLKLTKYVLKLSFSFLFQASPLILYNIVVQACWTTTMWQTQQFRIYIYSTLFT
jgi:hypothetical protein